MEKHYGKTAAEMAVYSEKLALVYLEKPSFQQVLKWNGRAKKNKVRQLGEWTLELLDNELFELQVRNLMDDKDEVSNVRERIQNLLVKHPDCGEANLYKAYLGMVRYKKVDDNLIFADAALRLAEKGYGEVSMEAAEIYRIKAIQMWMSAESQEHKREAVALNNKAYYVVTHAKDSGHGFNILRGIKRNMQF